MSKETKDKMKALKDNKTILKFKKAPNNANALAAAKAQFDQVELGDLAVLEAPDGTSIRAPDGTGTVLLLVAVPTDAGADDV